MLVIMLAPRAKLVVKLSNLRGPKLAMESSWAGKDSSMSDVVVMVEEEFATTRLVRLGGNLLVSWEGSKGGVWKGDPLGGVSASGSGRVGFLGRSGDEICSSRSAAMEVSGRITESRIEPREARKEIRQ